MSGAPAQRTSWTSGGQLAAGPQEEGQALLPRDPADEHHRRLAGVDAVVAHPVGVVDARPALGVDPVVDDVDLAGVDVGIGVEHVVAHRCRHRDHRGRAEVRRALGERRERVAAAELLGLPRPQRLQRVGRDHVGDVVQQTGESGRRGWRTRCGSGRGRCPRSRRRSRGRRPSSAGRRWPRRAPAGRRTPSRLARRAGLRTPAPVRRGRPARAAPGPARRRGPPRRRRWRVGTPWSGCRHACRGRYPYLSGVLPG